MLDHRQGQRSAALLLGKPPRAGTLLPEVMALLNAAEVATAVHLPHEEPELPGWEAGADLVVHRGLKWSARHPARPRSVRCPTLHRPAMIAGHLLARFN